MIRNHVLNGMVGKYHISYEYLTLPLPLFPWSVHLFTRRIDRIYRLLTMH